MRRFLRIAAIVLVALIATAALVLFLLYRATQHEPEFYVRALKAEPAKQAEAGDQLEKRVVNLRNEVRRDGDWEVVFTDEQINGWLATDLPEKFPDALPPEVSDPRVAIEPDTAQVACRYRDGSFTTVVSLAVEMHLTGRPNELAVRIRRARAGSLPVPISNWLDQVTEAALESGIPLRWEKKDGDPVAIVEIPFEHTEVRNRLLRVETIQLREGELYLAGRTQRAEELSARARVARTGAN